MLNIRGKLFFNLDFNFFFISLFDVQINFL